MSLRTTTGNLISYRHKPKNKPKAWLATTSLSLVAALAISLGMVQPVFALSGCEPNTDSYKCKIMSYYLGWRNVASLTYCFAQGAHTIKTTSGSVSAVPLSADRQPAIKAAANVWNGIPPVKLTVAACSAKTDIVIYGYHKGYTPKAVNNLGAGGCVTDDEAFCQLNSGVVFMNVDVPNTKELTKTWLYAGVHEFGHVLGLDHPSCYKTCVGPIMSYATCNDKSCPATPNKDDKVGIGVVYSWRSGSGGGCNLAPTTDTTSSTSSQTYLTDPLIATTPLPTVPDPNSITVPSTESITSLPTVGTIDELAVLAAPDMVYANLMPVEAGPMDTDVSIDDALATFTRLADPAVDANATLSATGGSISNEMNWIYKQIGLPDGTPNPAACHNLF
ncbi:MAG TPA: matrixin family metalloprotease [Candidatus Saccharimonadales bacterium]|nr:matrixin family metalloprotease [Candidatus Saccharimonadales bacterium]